jgi:hypothetical protein
MPADDWNPAPVQQPLIPPASPDRKPSESLPANQSRPWLLKDLPLYSPLWWQARRAYLASLCPRGLSERSQLAADLAAYNGNHHLPEADQARAWYVACAGAESCR